MNPITLATLAYGAYKMFKNRKPQVTRAGQTQNYAGAYPDATRRDSTERDDPNRPDPYTPPPPSDSAETPPAGGSNLSAREQRDRLRWSNTGRMEGFEVGSDYGGDLKARNSVKNTFGRIASRYEAKPSSIDAILNDPDFKMYFPNAKKVAFDKIDFGGVLSDFESGVPVTVVDVGNSFDPSNDTGRGWWWGTEGDYTSTGAKSGASSVGIKTPSSGSDQIPFPGMPERGTPQTFTSKVPGISVLTPEEIWSVPERPSPFASGATLGSMARRYR